MSRVRKSTPSFSSRPLISPQLADSVRNWLRNWNIRAEQAPPKTDRSTITLDAGNRLKTTASYPLVAADLASASVTFAKLDTTALPKQGAVSGSDFTMTSAGTTDVTGATITMNGPGLVICTGQVICAASVTNAVLVLTTLGGGAITGSWFISINVGATVGDAILFGTSFGPTSANLNSAGTYDWIFVGWCSGSGVFKLQAQSDGTRTLTIKIGSQVASSI